MHIHINLAGGEVNQPDGTFNKFQWLYRYA